MTTIPFMCPCCKKQLKEALENIDGEVKTVLWCMSWKCKSLACDMGGSGRTAQEAFDMLCKEYDKEPLPEETGEET